MLLSKLEFFGTILYWLEETVILLNSSNNVCLEYYKTLGQCLTIIITIFIVSNPLILAVAICEIPWNSRACISFIFNL